MFDQICVSPQVKRSAIISNKHSIYKLLDKLPNNLRLRIVRNQGIQGKSQKFIELHPSVQSSCQNENFVNY